MTEKIKWIDTNKAAGINPIPPKHVKITADF